MRVYILLRSPCEIYVDTHNDHMELDVENWVHDVIPTAALWPLLSFKQVTDFHVMLEWPALGEDALVQEMASSWKALTRMFFRDNEEHWESVPFITGAALVKLAASCSQLESVSIRGDKYHMPYSLPQTVDDSCRNEAVKAIDFRSTSKWPNILNHPYIPVVQSMFPNAKPGEVKEDANHFWVFSYPKAELFRVRF